MPWQRAVTLDGLVRLPSTGLFGHFLTAVNFVLIISSVNSSHHPCTGVARYMSICTPPYPHQRRVRWPTNAPLPSCAQGPRLASTNSTSSIYAKLQDVETRWRLPAPNHRPFRVILRGLHCRLKDHRLGLLNYCAVGDGFSRLLVGRILSSLHLCGHLLCVKHKCPVVGLFMATAFICILRPFVQGPFRQRPLIQGLFWQPFSWLWGRLAYFYVLFVTVVVAYASFSSRAHFWWRQYWKM